MFIQQTDGSVIDESGKILFFSTERFIRNIVEGDCCFICGADPADTAFNGEHILPDWILKRFDLRKQQITLPNLTGHDYGTYKVPCCEGCNTLMSKTFETPFSELTSKGHNAVVEHVRKEGPWKLFVWLNLIFLKTHLKDCFLPQYRDRRQAAGQIGDIYAWESLHHIHCVARSFFTRCGFDLTALGTLLILPAKSAAHLLPFDYRDTYEFQTILLRLGETAFLAVLNDSAACLNVFSDSMQRITGLLSPLQLREISAHLAYINSQLVERPKFKTNIKPSDNRMGIYGELPDHWELKPFDQALFGELQYEMSKDILAAYGVTDDVDAIKAGRWSFLFRPDGSFQENSMEANEASNGGN